MFALVCVHVKYASIHMRLSFPHSVKITSAYIRNELSVSLSASKQNISRDVILDWLNAIATLYSLFLFSATTTMLP